MSDGDRRRSHPESAQHGPQSPSALSKRFASHWPKRTSHCVMKISSVEFEASAERHAGKTIRRKDTLEGSCDANAPYRWPYQRVIQNRNFLFKCARWSSWHSLLWRSQYASIGRRTVPSEGRSIRNGVPGVASGWCAAPSSLVEGLLRPCRVGSKLHETGSRQAGGHASGGVCLESGLGTESIVPGGVQRLASCW